MPNLSDWAERVGMSKFTAYRWFREGTLPVRAQKLGRLILVDMAAPRVSVVARSSVPGRPPTTKRGDLDRQVARLSEWARRRGLSVDEVVDEVGSAMNPKRRKPARVLADPTALTVVSSTASRRLSAGVGRRRGRGR
jgi:putative resolvase